MARKIQFKWCDAAQKRSLPTEHDAEVTLGRVQTRRMRHGDSRGTRRGLKVEQRSYYCDACDGYHLSEMSKREYLSLRAVAA